jgi:hypothetical protein
MSNQNKKNESKAPDEKVAENKKIDGLKNESKVPDEKVAENKNIDDMKNGSIALLKDTKELIKTTSSSEDVEMTQKLIELHRNNEEVLNQLLTARSNHADIEPREKSTEVEIGGLQVTHNAALMCKNPPEFPVGKQMHVSPFVDIDSFVGELKAGEFIVIGKLYPASIILDIQVWFDKPVNDVRIGHVIDPSAYLDVRGRSLLKTSVEHDGGFDSIANTVSSNLCHVLLSLGDDFEGSFKTRITYNQ